MALITAQYLDTDGSINRKTIAWGNTKLPPSMQRVFINWDDHPDEVVAIDLRKGSSPLDSVMGLWVSRTDAALSFVVTDTSQILFISEWPQTYPIFTSGLQFGVVNAAYAAGQVSEMIFTNFYDPMGIPV